jgi:hypothetical protein
MPTTTATVSSATWSAEFFAPSAWALGTLPAHFLAALVEHLESHAPLLALLDGSPRVYVERAPTDAVAPYVLVEGVRLAPGESDDHETASFEVNAYGPNMPTVRRLGRAIVAAIDPPGLNADSMRSGPLAWAWGEEEVAMRTGGRSFRVPSGATGTRVSWGQTAEYDLHYRVPSDVPQATPDDPYAPATTHGSLAQALLGYLGASDALAALLGGHDEVYPDLAAASGETRPFVLVEDPQDDPDGEADEDESTRVAVAAQAKGLRVASAIHELLRDLIDAPGTSRRARRAAPLEWDGGEEAAVTWTGSRLELLPGLGPGGSDVWQWTAEYEFYTHRT